MKWKECKLLVLHLINVEYLVNRRSSSKVTPKVYEGNF